MGLHLHICELHSRSQGTGWRFRRPQEEQDGLHEWEDNSAFPAEAMQAPSMTTSSGAGASVDVAGAAVQAAPGAAEPSIAPARAQKWARPAKAQAPCGEAPAELVEATVGAGLKQKKGSCFTFRTAAVAVLRRERRVIGPAEIARCAGMPLQGC